MEKTKTLIIGSGPAGYTAAIYAGRANLRPVLYSGLQPGGQLTTTTLVENFPGFHEGIDANQLMNEMRQQAALYGADLRDGSIVKADLSSRPFHLEDERGNEIEAETVIIATGASAKYLGLADEEKYRGQGVSACATCDGFFYRKRTVAVVGGGDTACEEAMYLSGLAKKVYMIVRKPYLRAAEIMRKRVTEKENIEILYNTNTIGLYGENGVEGAHLVRFKGEKNEEKYDISIDGFFLAIGSRHWCHGSHRGRPVPAEAVAPQVDSPQQQGYMTHADVKADYDGRRAVYPCLCKMALSTAAIYQQPDTASYFHHFTIQANNLMLPSYAQHPVHPVQSCLTRPRRGSGLWFSDNRYSILHEQTKYKYVKNRYHHAQNDVHSSR